MKLRSVGMLAAAGMLLSSISVWSFAPHGRAGSWPKPAATVAGSDSPFSGAVFTAGGTLKMEGRMGQARLGAADDNESYLLVSLEAGQAAASTPDPLNLAIVIDRSGSMRGRKLENAVAAAQGMIQRLRDGDVVSVISYNTATQTLLPPTAIDSTSRARAVAAVSGLMAGGDTCISCGVEEGMAMLRQRDNMVDRILLLTDGKATSGVRGMSGFRALAGSVRDMGASISTIGVDVDFDAQVMTELAQDSNGHNYFVDDPSGLPAVFDQELKNLVHTVAKNAELSLDLAPGVELEQIEDRTFRREGRRVIVPMGDFASGERKTLLARVHIAKTAPGERPVADVHLGFDDLSNHDRGACSGTLAVLLTKDASDVSPLDPLVGARVDRSETADALREANRLFAEGRTEKAKSALTALANRVRANAHHAILAAPEAKKAEVAQNFQAQQAALDAASRGFATPPPPPGFGSAAAAPRPAQTRAGKAAVRRNANSAFELSR
jgi:Ca-activated chloride channel homolog